MALYFVDGSVKKQNSMTKFDSYKEAFVKSDHRDVTILMGLIRCYKNFLFAPFNVEGQGKTGKYLAIMLSILCLIYCYVAIKINYRLVIKLPVTTFILLSLGCVTNLLFLATCFLNSSVFKQENWKAVLRCVDQAEYMLRKLNFEMSKKDFLLYFQVVSIFLTYFAETSFQIYVWIGIENMDIFCASVGSVVIYLYMCLFLLFILRLTGMLKARYDFVDETVKKIATVKTSDAEKSRKLVEVVRLYKTLMVLMDNINAIFGSHLFFYVCASICYLLWTISYNLNVRLDNEKKMTSICFILKAITYAISLIVLILSCDSVEKSGARVIKTCYILHESCDSPIVKQHLLQLAQYAEQWRPTISAAGFYNVNQSTLSAIFEAMITYLVIIIQFNLALA